MNKKKNKIAIFLAARSGSKRLPNKHFLKITPKYKSIDLCILRLKKSKLVKKIFLCTTKEKKDNKFNKICKTHKINIFRGSTNNVLERFINCAKLNSIETIVRITADCPIIDAKLIDECIKLHFRKKSDYTSNTLKFTFPDGLDVEIINFNALIKSQNNSKTLINKEHVTPYIRKSKIFKKYNYENLINYGNRRWTLDYREDFIFLKKVLNYFSPNIYFSWKDVIKGEMKENFLINLRK